MDFIDFESAGMSRVSLPRPFTHRDGEKRVEWTFTFAALERDDRGRITRIALPDRTYVFTLDDEGAVTGVRVEPAG